MAISECKSNLWVITPKPNPAAALRLICFPYAGGNAAVYRDWPDGVPSNVEICAVQYPGRNNRLQEPPFDNLTPLVRATADALVRHLDRPFAFFGHSMGAKVGFELSRLLSSEQGLEPVHLFVSGSRAPQLPYPSAPTYNLPEPQFIEKLRNLNGTPEGVLEHVELLQLMIPLLRADFQVVQTYKYIPGPPLKCPISAFGGFEDIEITRSHLEGWREHTVSDFAAHMLPGDHFFVNTSRRSLLEIINGELRRSLTRMI